MTHYTLSERLHEAFPQPSDGLRTYINAYEALSHASAGTRRTALDANRTAWRALTEDERDAVDAALASAPLRVVG